MFSANTHQQQFLFHLSQIKPKRSSISIKNKSKLNQKKLQIEENATTTKLTGGDLKRLFPKSFNEALNNFKSSPLAALASKTSIEEILDNHTVEFTTNINKHKKPVLWIEKYVSKESFEQNKNENKIIDEPTINSNNTTYKPIKNILYTLFSVQNLTNPHIHVQRRYFKTERSIETGLRRNPTFSTRFKDIFSTPQQVENSGKINPNLFTNANSTQPTTTENLKILLQNDNLSNEDQKRVKIAFAEGYIAGTHSDNTQKQGKAMKYFKVFQQLLITLVFIGIFLTLFSSTNGSVFRIQIGNQVEIDPEDINITFDDVKGCDEAKQELKEIVEFLKNPDKFSNLGGKLPKGVLLVGPPGTGKTLLARAVAGEAGVPFFHAAGPEFDEVLVGQGARRVRELFKAAKERAPCVIFIDEIDSVGSKRTNSVLHPYANQTINQLLSEMDGFYQNEGVIVLGATNRRDDLDQALLRPGRFDVEVVVPTPDYTGRKEILDLYLGKVLHKDINIDMLARGTTGFTGADLENMVNQAALRAAIDGAEVVSMKHLESARDKVLMGPERKARVPDEEANKITAYHEGGHAIVAYYTNETHPLHKVTIMPRGPSLGHTAYIPEKERYHVTKSQLLAMMDTMMGGRAAEELIFGPDKITSGASSDLRQATAIAGRMVKDWGMSERVGLRTIEGSKGMAQGEHLGPTTVELVDAEIKKILSDSYERAKAILKAHSKEHKALAEALLKYETLDADDIKAIMTGEKPVPAEKSTKIESTNTVINLPRGKPLRI